MTRRPLPRPPPPALGEAHARQPAAVPAGRPAARVERHVRAAIRPLLPAGLAAQRAPRAARRRPAGRCWRQRRGRRQAAPARAAPRRAAAPRAATPSRRSASRCSRVSAPPAAGADRRMRRQLNSSCRIATLYQTFTIPITMNRRHFSSALLSSGAAGCAPRLPAVLAAAGGARRRPRLHQARAAAAPRRARARSRCCEFFSYACPHCNAFEPTIEAWARGLPADVVFKRVPVPFLFNADNFAHTYYALETMGAASTRCR